MYYTENDFRLYHHGIRGQKWGIRRYQNPDGSLTEEGRKRYQKGNYDIIQRQYKNTITGEVYTNKKTAALLRDRISDEDFTNLQDLYKKMMTFNDEDDARKETEIIKLMKDPKRQRKYEGLDPDDDLIRFDILHDHPELKTSEDYAVEWDMATRKLSEKMLGEYGDTRIKSLSMYDHRSRSVLANDILPEISKMTKDANGNWHPDPHTHTKSTTLYTKDGKIMRYTYGDKVLKKPTPKVYSSWEEVDEDEKKKK